MSVIQYRVIALLAFLVVFCQVTGSAQQMPVIQGKTPGGAYVPVQVDPLGVVQTSGGGGGGSVTQGTSPWVVGHTDTLPSTINITAADVASSTATGANGQSIITGTPTANSAAVFAIGSQAVVNLQVTGTWVGTLQTEVSFDGGTTWYIRGVHLFGTNYNASTFTANFGGEALVSGATNVRVRCTAYTSGTATVKVTESLNPGVFYLANTPGLADGTTPSQKLAIGSNGAASVQGNVASGASDSGNPNKIGGVYNTSLPTLTNGQRGDAQSDVNARLIVYLGSKNAGEDVPNDVQGTIPKPITGATYSYSWDTAWLTAVSHSTKGSAGQVFSVTGSSINAAVRYLQLFNKATGPVNTDVPVFSFPIPAGTSTAPATVTYDNSFFGLNGSNFGTGIAWGFSTTAATYTAGTSTDHTIHLAYQ